MDTALGRLNQEPAQRKGARPANSRGWEPVLHGCSFLDPSRIVGPFALRWEPVYDECLFARAPGRSGPPDGRLRETRPIRAAYADQKPGKVTSRTGDFTWWNLTRLPQFTAAKKSIRGGHPEAGRRIVSSKGYAVIWPDDRKRNECVGFRSRARRDLQLSKVPWDDR